jgi:hypothetical protein
MKRFNKLIGLVLVALVSSGYAHEGHDHDEEPVTQQEAAKIADRALVALVKNSEVDAAWKVTHRQATVSKQIEGARVWVTTYKKSVTGAAEEKLYIFMDEFVNYIEANKTGKL